MTCETLIQQLIKEEEIENGITNKLEEEIAKEIYSCIKIDSFYKLNFKRLHSILEKVGPLEIKPAHCFLSKMSEIYGGDSCILLKSLEIDAKSIDDCCYVLSSIIGSPICQLIKDFIESNGEVDFDWEYEIMKKDNEIQTLKESLKPKIPEIPQELLQPIDNKPANFERNIYKACEQGSIDSVKYLIQNGIDINKKNRDQVTPLMAACKHKQLKIVQFLLANGANINDQDNAGWSPLWWAIRGGSLPIIEFLVESGANIECCDQNNATPLMLAAEEANDLIVSYLINKGANPFAKDKFRNTAADLTDSDYIRNLILKTQKDLIQKHQQQNYKT